MTWHLRRLWTGLHAACPACLQASPGLVALLSLAPGLGHFWLDCDLLRAGAYWGASLFLLIWGLLFASLAWTPPLMAALFAFHNWVVLDSFMRARIKLGLPPLGRREAAKAFLKLCLLLALFYATARGAAGHFGALVHLQTDLFAPRLSRGDRLLVVRRRSYAPGDIVFSSSYGSVERVMAVPGQTVGVWADGVSVNGRILPKELQPLSSRIVSNPTLHGARLEVPPASYCVFFPASHAHLSRSELLQHFLIPQYLISGRVSSRLYPWPARF